MNYIGNINTTIQLFIILLIFCSMYIYLYSFSMGGGVASGGGGVASGNEIFYYMLGLTFLRRLVKGVFL